MVRIEVTRIKIGQTDELLTGQGGFLAFGESMKGMRLEERVMHLPAPGCNRGFDPGVSVRTSVSLQILGGQILPELRDLEREKTRPGLLDQTVIPDEDTVGQWLRRTGVPEKKQAGLAGLGGRPPIAGLLVSLAVSGRVEEGRAGKVRRSRLPK